MSDWATGTGYFDTRSSIYSASSKAGDALNHQLRPHVVALEDRVLPGDVLLRNLLAPIGADLLGPVTHAGYPLSRDNWQWAPNVSIEVNVDVLNQTALSALHQACPTVSLSRTTGLVFRSSAQSAGTLGPTRDLAFHRLDDQGPRRDDTRGVIAQTGFNDAVGMNSNGRPSSPYGLGSVNGGGVGENGWVKPWVGDAKSIVQNSVVFEGDQALEIQPTSQPHRSLAEPQYDVFSIQEHVRFDAGARLVAYTEVEATGQAIANHGAIWAAFPDGRFYVVDGMGDSCIVCDTEFTGFTWTPGVWYEIGRRIDVPNQTWEFYVNGDKYNAPDRLGFRGTPEYLDRVEYLSEGSGSVYLDAIRFR